MLSRRTLVSAALAAPLAPVAGAALAADARAAEVPATDLPAAVQATFAPMGDLPGTKSCFLVGEGPKGRWQGGLEPERPMFIGSAFKTFVLAQVLRAVEAGTLNENDQWTVDDAVRNSGSQTLEKLTGSTTARCVLEAMITHSDNTATDISLAKAGPDTVRALIREAGLGSVRIPASTRRMVSYIAGAPVGTDIGWAGVEKLASGWLPGTPRPPINDVSTMMASTADLVSWYRQALTGTFFRKPETLVEYKRILSMADALAVVVPDGLSAYGKGGSIQWQAFNCFSLAGQMVVGEGRVTFGFNVNWTGPESGIPAVFADFAKSVAETLRAAAAGTRA